MTDQHTDAFLEEAESFIADHPDLSEWQAAVGGTIWGLLRALMECPNCPGHFRVPLRPEEERADLIRQLGILILVEREYLYCPHCGNVWERQEDAPPPKPKRKRKKQ